MRVVALVRKPFQPKHTITSTCVSTGCGSINIDDCRISMKENGNTEELQTPTGRWPANLIVQHLDGCKVVGFVNQSFMINQWVEGAQPFGGAAGKPYEGSVQSISNEKWACVQGCPAAHLNEVSEAFDTGGTADERACGVARFFKQVVAPPKKD